MTRLVWMFRPDSRIDASRFSSVLAECFFHIESLTALAAEGMTDILNAQWWSMSIYVLALGVCVCVCVRVCVCVCVRPSPQLPLAARGSKNT